MANYKFSNKYQRKLRPNTSLQAKNRYKAQFGKIWFWIFPREIKSTLFNIKKLPITEIIIGPSIDFELNIVLILNS